MILSELFEPVITEGRHDPHAFKAIFLCGPPGTGKTTIENRLGLQALGLKSLDLDQIVHYLKRMPSYPPVGKLEENSITNYVHASKMHEKLLKMWANEHLGFIVQMTGRNEHVIIDLNRQLNENYYHTLMLMVTADKEVAQNRVQSRPAQSTRPADKGRQVSMDFFNHAYEAVKSNIPLYEQMFGDNFILVENNGEASDQQSFNNARRKVNAFLQKDVTPEASTFLKGVKMKTRGGRKLGRNYAS